MQEIVVIIPAYNPDFKLLKLLLELIDLGFLKIIVINDGSLKSKKIFQKIKKLKQCVLLEYSNNKGKGYALKYGINYYLENYVNDYQGIVTVDADYQHLPNDILNVSKKLLGNQDSLILGIRDFNYSNVPKANSFGNKITSFIFKLLYGSKIIDTQTGLRGIPNRYLNFCLETKGVKFEYEMNMLINFSKKKINILQIPIETIYFNKEKSNFNKFLDSLRIYKVLLTEYFKFIFSSLLCSLIDISLFTFFLKIFANLNSNILIIISTFLARIIADFFNFNINKSIVFLSKENSQKIFIKYYILSFIKMIFSATLVLIFSNLFININEIILKIIIDILIFTISYKIQKKYIFKT